MLLLPQNHTKSEIVSKNSRDFPLRFWAGTLDYSAAFDLFDGDHDGNATPDELHSVFIRCHTIVGQKMHWWNTRKWYNIFGSYSPATIWLTFPFPNGCIP